jgi:hypothetical protein
MSSSGLWYQNVCVLVTRLLVAFFFFFLNLRREELEEKTLKERRKCGFKCNDVARIDL